MTQTGVQFNHPAASLPGREEFGIPTGIAYLNAAASGPVSHLTKQAGERALGGRAAPWGIDSTLVATNIEKARCAAAALINADPEDMALVTSVSHAVAVAAGALPAVPGARILRLAGEHPSTVLSWAVLKMKGCIEQIVDVPDDGDWTAAVLEALDNDRGAPLAVVALGGCHWRDGARLNLEVLAPAIRARGAALFVDATHWAGIEPFDVAQLQPDFVAFPLFKWLLGPYGVAFVYVARAWQSGNPTDWNAANCVLATDFSRLAAAQGARRYDRGQRDEAVAAAMGVTSLTQIAGWGVANIAVRVRALADQLIKAAEGYGAQVLPAVLRVPHIIGLKFNAGLSAADLVRRLAAAGVIVSERSGVVRVAPHFYNDQSDVDRFAVALDRAIRARGRE